MSTANPYAGLDWFVNDDDELGDYCNRLDDAGVEVTMSFAESAEALDAYLDLPILLVPAPTPSFDLVAVHSDLQARFMHVDEEGWELYHERTAYEDDEYADAQDDVELRLNQLEPILLAAARVLTDSETCLFCYESGHVSRDCPCPF